MPFQISEDLPKRACQTASNRSRGRQFPCPFRRAELTPLGGSGPSTAEAPWQRLADLLERRLMLAKFRLLLGEKRQRSGAVQMGSIKYELLGFSGLAIALVLVLALPSGKHEREAIKVATDKIMIKRVNGPR